jgi:hypothetical protein
MQALCSKVQPEEEIMYYRWVQVSMHMAHRGRAEGGDVSDYDPHAMIGKASIPSQVSGTFWYCGDCDEWHDASAVVLRHGKTQPGLGDSLLYSTSPERESKK